MELSTATEFEGVLQQQESPKNTPVARKTRSAAQKKLKDNKMELGNESVLEDDVLNAPPKTPSTAVRQVNETPRRSARKSVRPPLDYADIIEKHPLCSVSKGSTEDKEEGPQTAEDHAAQKWTVAEVGRHSHKRNRSRKSKRSVKQEKVKIEEESSKVEGEGAAEMKEEQVEPQSIRQDKAKGALNQKIKLEEKSFEVMAETEENGEKELDKEEEEELVTAEPQPKGHNKAKPANKKAAIEKESSVVEGEEERQENVAAEEEHKEKQEQLVATETVTAELQSPSQDKDKSKSSDEIMESTADEREEELQKCSPAPVMKSLLTAKSLALEADMDELGLCPLDAEEHTNEDDEMPSLILLDDDGPEAVINLTFDADEKDSDEENMPTLCIDEPQQQLDNDIDIDVDMKNLSPAEHKSKPYRFPTPHKCKAKPKFSFSNTTTTTGTELTANMQNLEVPGIERRKRSKSVSGLNETKAKTVSFFSPIEVAIVNDIDKRWENLNNSHVTQRRKRSKSLDENRQQISRIPKPKPYPPVKGAVTSSKQKLRTKLPNFAAIHQKQFEKMENLVDHMERKAERAKVLTNSAIKQKQRQATLASAQKTSARKLVASQSIAASKKIVVPNYTMTPMKPEELERQRRLPTPRKIVAVAQPKAVAPTRIPLANNQLKPAFNLSASVVAKMFIPGAGATPGSRVNKPAESTKNKLETRRQRHMEMFKMRGPKEQRSELIRGVRSNRRFELQMQHRRQLDENTG